MWDRPQKRNKRFLPRKEEPPHHESQCIQISTSRASEQRPQPYRPVRRSSPSPTSSRFKSYTDSRSLVPLFSQLYFLLSARLLGRRHTRRRPGRDRASLVIVFPEEVLRFDGRARWTGPQADRDADVCSQRWRLLCAVGGCGLVADRFDRAAGLASCPSCLARPAKLVPLLRNLAGHARSRSSSLVPWALTRRALPSSPRGRPGTERAVGHLFPLAMSGARSHSQLGSATPAWVVRSAESMSAEEFYFFFLSLSRRLGIMPLFFFPM